MAKAAWKNSGKQLIEQFVSLLASLCLNTYCNPRRGAKPSAFSSNSLHGVVGSHAEPISEDNIGSRMLRGMGWSPGQGLGVENNGLWAVSC